MRLSLSEEKLDAAVRAGVLDAEQARALWGFLADTGGASHETARFKMAHLLYYFGGLIAIGAISVFITVAWEAFGAWPLLLLGVAMGLLGYALARRFIEVDRQPIAAGTMAALLITAVPMTVFALQHVLGFWAGDLSYADYHRWIDWRWLMMEFATLAAGAVVLWRFRLPFAMLPIAVTLWYLSMDLAAFLAQDSDGWFSDPSANGQVGIWGALLSLVGLGAYLVSRKLRRDWAGALIGLLPFVITLYFFFQNVNRLLPPNL